MVHICKGNFPTVFSNHCHHGYCGGRAQSTINIFNNCGGGHTNFWGGFGAGLGFGLGNLFGGFGMGNIFGGFGMGMPMFGGMGMGMPMFGGMNMWSPWQSFGMDQFQWNNGRNNGSTDGTNKGSNNSNKPGDAKADFIDEDDIKIKEFEDAINNATTPAEIDKAIKGLTELKLKDNYKNDKNTEENAIANIIAKAEANKAKLEAEQAKQLQQPGQVTGEKLADQDNGKVEAPDGKVETNGKNNGAGNTDGDNASAKNILDKLNGFTLPDGYTKIEDGKFDNEKSVYAHDEGDPADVNPSTTHAYYGKKDGYPETITITDTKGTYKYDYQGKTGNGYPIYKSMTTDNYYALVEKDGKNVLLQQGEAFRGLGLNKTDRPSVKETTPAAKKVKSPEQKPPVVSKLTVNEIEAKVNTLNRTIENSKKQGVARAGNFKIRFNKETGDAIAYRKSGDKYIVELGTHKDSKFTRLHREEISLKDDTDLSKLLNRIIRNDSYNYIININGEAGFKQWLEYVKEPGKAAYVFEVFNEYSPNEGLLKYLNDKGITRKELAKLVELFITQHENKNDARIKNIRSKNADFYVELGHIGPMDKLIKSILKDK